MNCLWNLKLFDSFSDYEGDYSGNYEGGSVNGDEDHIYIDGSVVSDSCAGNGSFLFLRNVFWAE